MANGSVITTLGHKVTLNRAWKATPDYSSPSQFKVGTGTNTPVAGDSNLQTPVTIDADQFKDFVATYPSLDETNLQATVRGLLLSTEANTNNLTEFGLFNTDGTPKMFSRSVFTAVTKNSSTQVIFVEKDRLA